MYKPSLNWAFFWGGLPYWNVPRDYCTRGQWCALAVFSEANGKWNTSGVSETVVV